MSFSRGEGDYYPVDQIGRESDESEVEIWEEGLTHGDKEYEYRDFLMGRIEGETGLLDGMAKVPTQSLERIFARLKGTDPRMTYRNARK